jgi:hypothetical protein
VTLRIERGYVKAIEGKGLDDADAFQGGHGGEVTSLTVQCVETYNQTECPRS